MKISMRFKVLAGISVACLVGVAVTIMMERLSFERGFLGYLNNQQRERMETISVFLGRYYEQQDGWGELPTAPELERALAFFERRLDEGQRRNTVRPPAPNAERPQVRPQARIEGPSFDLGLVDASGTLVAGPPVLLERQDLMRVPVFAFDGREQVGELISPPMLRFSGPIEQQFTQAQMRRSMIVALLSLVVVLPLALLFAHLLLRQVQHLALGVHNLTAGRYDQNIQLTRNDELGQLATDINKLGQTLNANRASQRRWIADISHELRTPVAILAGEIDALVDGVREPNERELKSLAGEVGRLRRLIEDLYMLSRSDAGDLSYNMEKLDLRDPVEDCLHRFTERLAESQLTLESSLPATSMVVLGDNSRLEQLAGNLLENSCRYTDPGGVVRVEVSRELQNIVLRIEDSAPGVPEEALPKLQDRLFRAEQSRSREFGGAGLGLSIAANIVAAHSGEMRFSASSLGGLCVEIRLPGVD